MVLHFCVKNELLDDISQKLNSEFLIGYFNGLITSVDDTIIYSFINIPLFTLIVIVILIIYEVDKKEKKYNLLESSLPYVIFYITFYALTAPELGERQIKKGVIRYWGSPIWENGSQDSSGRAEVNFVLTRIE